jgi:DNA repair protein RecN (Recombination protein N)
MIVELSVENLAVIERCDLALGPGFTALTGETGAGKSLIVDALELAFGARADTTLVRTGAAKALVSVAVDLSARPDVLARCRELGAQDEEGVLYLQREVFAEGRSQCRIGGRLAPVAHAREIGLLLVDLHGQHDHQSLLDPKCHLAFLDAWIGEEAEPHRKLVEERLEARRALERRLGALRGNRREREQRADLLRFQVKEIEEVGPRVGELAELEGRLARLQHAQRLAETIAAVRQALFDGEPAGRDQLASAAKELADAERLDPGLAKVREPLVQAEILVEEALAELRAYESNFESSPELLEETAARRDALQRLMRKYGDDERALLEHLEACRTELGELTGDESDEDALSEAAEQARIELNEACQALSGLRQKRAETFCASVEEHLQDLAMGKARFRAAFQPQEPDETGADAMEFLFSANAGEPPKPLSKIASGGEISRAMLAIKSSLLGRAGVPCVIFDEVDVGLGGQAAAAVAKKIEQLAQHEQVLVITHLPQIASRATAHYRVEKEEREGRVVAVARRLDERERVAEIARMLAGEKVGGSALTHAEELLRGS